MSSKMLPFRINASLDAAFIFDMYSIIIVKLEKGLADEDESHRFLSGIIHNIGHELAEEIISSEEFSDLIEANSKTFDAVNLARTDDILASEVDKLNTIRFKCKAALQKKFFNSELGEKKNV